MAAKLLRMGYRGPGAKNVPAPMRAPQILLLALVIVLFLSFEFIGARMRQPEPKDVAVRLLMSASAKPFLRC